MHTAELYHKDWGRRFQNKWIPGLFLIFLFRVSGMFVTCLAFNQVRQEGGSVPGAILSHAGFNFGMGFLIFYAI